MNKNTKEAVYNKYDGKCAYCGKEIESPAKMKYACINPNGEKLRFEFEDGEMKLVDNDDNNYIPVCERCKRHSGNMNVEEYREYITGKMKSKRKTELKFAEEFTEDGKIVFFFEKQQTK